ncbi:RluA family pseudouridine synthase [Croceicoccus sp. F390]|uniref:Ribosomal large subunit pseudouridine synthase D n=1 Tax=Croceicoccus esteveae TaxID=3075597 RepID=A0ABU2ZDG6_9SPHN|nr:RluA family pseudouridine synthase [Croceicoccus sp. F390]MDT0574645.1 RluA family pseudouridine synthase [Croceicoccus sp. F390]
MNHDPNAGSKADADPAPDPAQPAQAVWQPAGHGGTSADVRKFTVGSDDAGVRLDRWFKRHMPQVGFATVSRWVRTGQVRVDGARAKLDDRVNAGQQIRVPPVGDAPAGARERRQLSPAELEQADAMLLHRDRAAIVLNKPPGLATQGGTGTHSHVDGMLDAYVGSGDKAPRPRLVHRLDKDTSGVLLIAATPGSAAFFSRSFAGRSARKIYWALVVGVPKVPAGLIDLAIGKQPGTGGEKMMPDEKGQAARTRYRVIERAGNRAAWVELEPLTGRTHQLRVHLAAIGHPIVGDGKYGGPDGFLTGSISRKMHLHARRLVIEHPDGTPLDIVAPLPEHFSASMEQLGFDPGLSDATPHDIPEPTREDRKQFARRHAKQVRKERRGERRGERHGSRRGKDGTEAAPGKPASGKSGPAAQGRQRPGGRPAGGKAAPGKRPSPSASRKPGRDPGRRPDQGPRLR